MVLKERQSGGRRGGRQGGGPGGRRAGMRVYGGRYRRRRRRVDFLLLSVLAVLALAGAATGALLDGARLAGGESVIGRIDAPHAGAAPEAAEESPGEAPADAAGREAGRTDAGPGTGGAEGTEEAAGGGTEGAGTEGADGEEARAEAAKEGAAGGEGGQADAGPQIPVPATNDLWMTIPKMGLYDDYVTNSEDPVAMDQGAIKLPSTAFPWQESANTYIAAHRIGYPGTESDYQFYDLPNLALGDRIYLGDANGTTYTYEVTGFKEVLPSETYVTAPQAGRDMISLQTCIQDYGDYWTMGPNWYVRYVVQADRVSVDPA